MKKRAGLDAAYHNLAIAALTDAVKIFNKSKRSPTNSVIAFFMSDTFDLFCELADINPDWMLRKLGIDYKYLPGKIQ